jgi:acetyltransferase-like isoleucine patch superfamily enzyme
MKQHVDYHHPPDRASKRTYTFGKLVTTWLRLIPYGRQIRRGEKIVVGRNVVFRLTDNAEVSIGDHSVIDDGSYFILTKPHPKLLIGEQVGLGLGTMIAIKATLSIGDYTRFGAGVIIRDNVHDYKSGETLLKTDAIIKPVTIGKHVWIGDRAMIFPGVSIGDGAVVSAGSIVTKDVPAHTLVRGQPAVVVRQLK